MESYNALQKVYETFTIFFHIFRHHRQVSSSGSERSPSISSFDNLNSSVPQSKIRRSLKLKTPKLLKNYVTKQLPKSLSLNDISPAAPPELPIAPKRLKKLKSTEEPKIEEKSKKKSPISRAVHKSVKRIKSVDLSGLISLRNNQKLRKSVKNERIGYNVSNSTFFQTPADEEIPTEILEEEIVPQVIIEEEDLSEVDETISDDQTLVHDVENAAHAVISLQGVSDTEFDEDFQVISGKKFRIYDFLRPYWKISLDIPFYKISNNHICIPKIQRKYYEWKLTCF